MAINQYVKKPNEDNSLLGQIAKPAGLLGGLAAVAAPFTGGTSLAIPAAAAAATGSAVGMADQMNKEQIAKDQPKQLAPVPQDQNMSMSRRFEQMSNDPGVQIADASAAMAKMPPDIQQEYGPVLSQAQRLAQSRRV